MSGLRLIGLAATGSIPVAIVGLIALFSMRLLVRLVSTQSHQTRKEALMGTANHLVWHVGITLSEIIWAIGTGVVAGALPA